MDDGSIASDVAEVAAHAGGGFLGELKKIGQVAVTQITGSPQTQTPTAQDVTKLSDKDKKFSEAAQAEIQARIKAIYEEHAARRRKEEMAKRQQEAQIEQQEEGRAELAKKQEKSVPLAAIEKTKAEIKNYGAE